MGKEEERPHCAECNKFYDKLDMNLPKGLRPVLATGDEICLQPTTWGAIKATLGE